MDNDQLEQMLGSRAVLYAMIARVFDSPINGDFQELARSEEGNSLLAVAIKELPHGTRIAVCMGMIADPCISLDALNSDYTRLFEGPGPLPAKPWEGVYRSRRNEVFQENTLEVRDCYRVAGYTPVSLHQVPDDSLAVQLNFVAAVAQDAAKMKADEDMESLRRALALQLSFLRNHLSYLAYHYSKSLIAANPSLQSEFYPAAVDALLDFIEGDVRAISSVLDGGLGAVAFR